MQVGISPDLVEKITGLFDTIFGRKPSDDETAQAAEFLAANGDDLELLRDSLAHSAEARQQIQNLLSEAFGQQVDGATVDLWISALADNLSLDQIRDLLNEI